MNMQSQYQTKDLSEASFLYASGAKLLKLNRENSNRVWFIFADKDFCEREVDLYWRKEATVNAKGFADSIRTLKDLIFKNQSR